MSAPLAISTAPSASNFSVAPWRVTLAAHLLGAGLLLAVLVALPAAPSDLDRHQLPKEAVVQVAVFAALLIGRPMFRPIVRPAMRWGGAILLAAALLSAMLSTNGWLAWRAWSLMVTGVVAFFTARSLAGVGQAMALLGWCALAGLVGGGAGLAQAYGLESPLFAVTRVPGGTLGNRNFMAHLAAMTLPVLLWIAMTQRRRIVSWMATLSLAPIVAAIVLSRSRAAWLAAALGTAIFALALVIARRRARPDGSTPGLSAMRPRWLVVAAAFGIVAALVTPNQLHWRSDTPYSDTLLGLANHDDGSGRGRLLQYGNTWQLARQHPLLGVGPGNWPVRYGDVAPPDDPSWAYGDVVPINPWPSSDWMALLSETGLIGLFGALLLGASIAWRAIRPAIDPCFDQRTLAGAALLALIGVVFVEGSFDAVLLLPVPLLFMALATGAFLHQCEAATPHELDLSVGSSRVAVATATLLGLIAFSGIVRTAAYVVAGNGRSSGRLQWAARLNPGSYPIRIALAQRLPCVEAIPDIDAVIDLAPHWPASIAAARRCHVSRRSR